MNQHRGLENLRALLGVLAAVGIAACGAKGGPVDANATATGDALAMVDGAADSSSVGAADTASPTDAVADVTGSAETAGDGEGADVAIDLGPQEVLMGCAPDPTPTWLPPGPDQAGFVGAPIPGDDCAPVGWVTLPEPTAEPWTRVTDSVGLGALGIFGQCLAWHDVNGDGLGDLVAVLAPDAFMAPQKLLIAQGDGKGHFTPAVWPIGLLATLSDCVVADLDGDGQAELTLTSTGQFQVLALHGPEPGKDLTAQFTSLTLPPTRTVTPMDIDSDGDLDLYVTASFALDDDFLCLPTDAPYTTCCMVPMDAECMAAQSGMSEVHTCCDISGNLTPQFLLRNDKGKFTDVSAPWGLQNGYQETISPFDLDRNGVLDFFGGDDFGVHGWFHQEGSGLKYYTAQIGMRPYGHLMGSVVADFDLDHHEELVIANIGADTIYRHTGGGFEDVSAAWNLWPATEFSVTWAEVAEDFDHDGLLDLLTTASLIAKPGQMQLAAKKDPSGFDAGYSMVFHNTGASFDPQFLMWEPGVEHEIRPAVATLGDIDGDHDQDIFFTEPGGKLVVWRNNTPPGRHWLTVRPHAGKQPVVNALVQLWADGHVQERWIQLSTGFGAHVLPEAHFGLGSLDHVDLVRIWWPWGQTTTYLNPPVDQVLDAPKP